MPNERKNNVIDRRDFFENLQGDRIMEMSNEELKAYLRSQGIAPPTAQEVKKLERIMAEVFKNKARKNSKRT
ncbi:MAG TPA: hypothetical protein VI957_01790 [Candidatus Paceibacterota bacterium]